MARQVPHMSGDEWRDRAACAGMETEVFFPGPGVSTRAAKQVCEGCPVTVACLAFANEAGTQAGIWGGVFFGPRRYRPRSKGVD
jgi:WhiB family transcriptional regulator, redox-sensing transcriptional regulator